MAFLKSKNRIYKILLTLINLIFIYYICSGIRTSFILNSADRTLWADEAMLAASFTKRSFLEIITLGEFEHLQSAPLLWLLYEKILAICFGHTAYVLRFGSVICYLLTIFLLIFIQKKFFSSKLPLLSAALFSTLSFVLLFSSTFKQYVSDGFLVLLIFSLYTFYIKDKISRNTLRLFYCIIIWASQVSCFFIGGVILTELIFCFSIKNKTIDKNKLKETIVTGILVCLSFIIYFLVFANRMTSVKGMQSFWLGFFFPLFPLAEKDFGKVIQLTKDIFSIFTVPAIFLPSFLIGSIYFSFKKEKAIISIYLGVFLVLLASYLHMYPIVNRTCFFIYPTTFLIFSLLIEDFILKNSNNEKLKTVLTGIFLFFILQYNNGPKSYKDVKKIYGGGEELNKELDYLKGRLKSDEMIYIYKRSVPSFEFKNGYNNHSFNSIKNNVILGTTFFDNSKDSDNEIRKILSYKKIYLATSHLFMYSFKGRFQRLIDTLHANGYLELIYLKYDAPLWYFCKKKKDSKFNYELELINKQVKEDTTFATIRIKNTGESYINYEQNKSYLLNKKNKNIFFLEKPLAPKEFDDIVVFYKTNSRPSFTLRHQFGKISKRKILKNL